MNYGTAEEWRQVHGYEGTYEISNLGHVRSLPRIVKHSSGKGDRHLRGRVLKNSLGADGYHRVDLCIDGIRKPMKVHQMVFAAFIGPVPTGHEVCHNDGDKTNNQPSNLRHDTRQSNVDDMLGHGTRVYGSAHWRSKLTECDVVEIRRRNGLGHSQQTIAESFGVTQSQISHIVRGRSWSWFMDGAQQ
jgi:DNA-binding transcriptional regulator YiaG